MIDWEDDLRWWIGAGFVLLALALAVRAIGQEDEQKEKVPARPTFAELQTIVSLGLDECYWQDNSQVRYEGTLDSYLKCMEEFIAQVRRSGVGAYKLDPGDLNKDENNQEIKPRREQ